MRVRLFKMPLQPPILTIPFLEIGIAGGTFTGPKLKLTRNYTISGSWNKNNNTQDVMLNPTKLDGEASHRIMQIQQGIRVRLLQLEFLNGYDGDKGTRDCIQKEMQTFHIAGLQATNWLKQILLITAMVALSTMKADP